MATEDTKPPRIPAKSAIKVMNGIEITTAKIRGRTRKFIMSKPMVFRESISSETFIVPISAAKAEPERPAMSIAVISGASSRVREMPISPAIRLSPPNFSSIMAPWYPVTKPMRKSIRNTIGIELMPDFIKWVGKSIHLISLKL